MIEFCGTHKLYSQKDQGDNFVIRVPMNAIAVSGCSTGVTCEVGCGSTDEWTLESTDKSGNDSFGASCGCA